MTGIEFRVLGPVEILQGGQVQGPTTAQQRTVLAMLLMDLGHVVSTGRMASALWAAEPPASARNSIRVHVTKLRKLLAADPTVQIATVGQGWRLVCDRERVDLYRFRALVDRARNVDGDESSALLREALALWRGPALADVAGEWLTEVVVESLEEERLTAVEDRISLDLESASHQSAVPELSVLVAQHPLRERPAGLLMSALHRGGRTAEGLAVFHRTRKRLVEELGIEPSAAFQRQHQLLLRVSGEGDVASDGELPVPRQLPVDLGVFAGREVALARLDALLERCRRDGTMMVATVSGIPGSGKTSLAVRWAHRVRDRFPDGQLYVNLRGFDATGAVDPAEVASGFLVALGVAEQRIPAEAEARSALLRSLLADRQMLIVLDNAQDEAQVRPLLPGSAGCCVIVTSRLQLTGMAARDGAQLLALDVFDHAEALALLTGRLGATRVRSEPEAAARIIERCAGLPLSLTMIAARAAAQPDFALSALAAELEDNAVVLDFFASPDAAVDLRTAFSWSYLRLSPEAARLFRYLGLHSGPHFGIEAAASLVAETTRDTMRSIRELDRAQLLTECAPGRFELHDLLIAYAAELTETLDTEDDRRAAVHRLLDHYLHTARAASGIIAPHRTGIPIADRLPGSIVANLEHHDQAAAWFESERATLVNALAGAHAQGFDAHTWQLAQQLGTYLRRKGLGAEWLTAQELALSAADRIEDARAQAITRYGLAAAQCRFGEREDAERHLHEALALFEALGDFDWQAHANAMLCVTSELVEDYAAVLAYATKSLELYRRAGDRPGQARALNNIGYCHAKVGDHHRALQPCRDALAIARDIGDPMGEANTLDSLGVAYAALGEYERAIDCFQRSASALLQLGEQYLAAVTLHRLGDAHIATGERDNALEVWKRALRGFEELDHPCGAKVRAKLIATAPTQPTSRLHRPSGLASIANPRAVTGPPCP